MLKSYFDAIESEGWEAIDPRLLAADLGVFPDSLLSLRSLWELALEERKRTYQEDLADLVSREIWEELSPLEQASEKILLHFEGLMAWRPALRKLYTTAFSSPLSVTEFVAQVGPVFWSHLSHFLSLFSPSPSLELLKFVPLYGRIFEVWLDDETQTLEKTLGKATEELEKIGV